MNLLRLTWFHIEDFKQYITVNALVNNYKLDDQKGYFHKALNYSLLLLAFFLLIFFSESFDFLGLTLVFHVSSSWFAWWQLTHLFRLTHHIINLVNQLLFIIIKLSQVNIFSSSGTRNTSISRPKITNNCLSLFIFWLSYKIDLI